jgi:Rrf2 family transcriptional regulator, iron-sulfur cluster assembly transcription factor
MRLTSRGRVAVTSLVDMARNQKNGQPVKLSDISKRQNITVTFLEQVFYLLRKNGVVKSSRGPQGGYFFVTKPNLIMISDVIKAIEEDLKITNCNGIDYGCKSANNRNSKCLTHNLWHELKKHMMFFLDSVSIEDVRENNFFGKGFVSVDKPQPNNQINV